MAYCPLQNIKGFGKVAYELEIPHELASVHIVFHISGMKKYIGDPSLILLNKVNGIRYSLSYDEILVQILDHQVHKLRTKEVASVKVLWSSQFVEEDAWEGEEHMKKIYSQLFKSEEIPDQGNNSLLSTL